MKIGETGQLLRVFIGESDEHNGEPLYRAIVLKARELGLAGATVLRGAMGFGANSRLHTTRLLELSENLPVRIEIIDLPERIGPLLTALEAMIGEGLVVIHDVHVLRYVPDPKK